MRTAGLKSKSGSRSLEMGIYSLSPYRREAVSTRNCLTCFFLWQISLYNVISTQKKGSFCYNKAYFPRKGKPMVLSAGKKDAIDRK
jgi:hypothetical protein